MSQRDLILRPLRYSDERTFRAAVEAFADADPDFGFAFGFDTPVVFSQYVDQVHAWSRGECLPETFVPNSYLVGIVDDQVVGRISLRHRLNDYLLHFGGHIGYGVIPSHRKRGYASQMLQQTLPIAQSLGIPRLLVTADENNLASQRVIEKVGGLFESTVQEPGALVRKKRYWIDVAQHSNRN